MKVPSGVRVAMPLLAHPGAMAAAPGMVPLCPGPAQWPAGDARRLRQPAVAAAARAFGGASAGRRHGAGRHRRGVARCRRPRPRRACACCRPVRRRWKPVWRWSMRPSAASMRSTSCSPTIAPAGSSRRRCATRRRMVCGCGCWWTTCTRPCSDRLLADLAAQPGVQLRLFNPLPARGGSVSTRLLLSLHELGRINRRMHNKLLLVDGSFAIVGGRNIADAYFERVGEPDHFIDMDVLLAGPAVRELGAVFDRFWNSPQAWTHAELVAGTVPRTQSGTTQRTQAPIDGRADVDTRRSAGRAIGATPCRARAWRGRRAGRRCRGTGAASVQPRGRRAAGPGRSHACQPEAAALGARSTC